MANTNVNTDGVVKYLELTDEHIADVKRQIEIFVKSDEYWDNFAHHSIVARGHRTFTSRRLIKPRVRPEDISPRAELIAPRATKMSVMTFEKTVQNYGDKAYYTREDLQYHFDDTVDNLAMTLKEVAIQKLDLIKGKAFVSSRALLTYDSSTGIIGVLKKATLVLRKNHVKRYSNGKWLVHITAEGLEKFRTELEAKHQVISEDIKVKLGEGLESIGNWGDFIFSVADSPIMYPDESHQYLVIMGRREIDGESPVDVSKLEGESAIEVFNNGLGSGVIEDEDGKVVSDDNKQKGSLAINMDGLGATVSDDLAILNCIITLDEVKGSELNLAELTGFKSSSPVSTVIVRAYASTDAGKTESKRTLLTDTTVVLKEKDSSGATVTASNGAYPVTAGNTYYYSVVKSGYTTVTGTFVANAGNTLVDVYLVVSQ